MTTFAKLMFLIATIPPSLAIAGGGKEPGTFGEVPPERVKQVNDAFALFEAGKFDVKDAALGGLIPEVDSMDPGPHCLGPIAAFGHFEKPLTEQTLLGMKFGVGVVGDLGLVADATRMGAEASIGLGLEFGGIMLGEHRKGDDKNYMRPLEIRFDALTHTSGDSDLSVSLYAFGYQLGSETLASTSATLAYANGFAWNLPFPVDGGWQDTFACDSSSCDGSYGFTYEAVATASAMFSMRLDAATGITTAALGGVQSFAQGEAAASYKGIGITQTNRFDLIHGTFSARGRIAPHTGNGDWIADAEYWGTLQDTLEGRLQFEFTIPIVDETLTFTPFSLDEQNYNQLWSYQCTIEQPF